MLRTPQPVYQSANDAGAPSPAMKALSDEIKGNMTRILTLEGDIAKGVAANQGVAEMKAEVNRISEANAVAFKAVQDRIDASEIATRLASQMGGTSAKTAGQLFTESDEFKSATSRDRVSPVMIDRAALKAVPTIPSNANAPAYGTEIVRPQNKALRMRGLIPGGRTERQLFLYSKLTTRPSGAATVLAGGLKPESAMVLTNAQATLTKIAHWIPVNDEQLSDVDGLRSLIDAEMEYGILVAEDAKILNGPGPDGTDMYGIIPQATAYAAATYGTTVTAATRIDHIRGMIAQLQVADYGPDGIVLHPLDWFKIETTKTTDGAYVFANPQGIAAANMWGVPVATTTQITADNALVGAFQIGAQLLDGQLNGTYGIQIKTGYINDGLIRNQMVVLAEERLMLLVKRPGAFVYGDLTPA